MDKYYSDMDEGGEAESASEPTTEKKPSKGKTTLIPKALLGGKVFEPGDTITLKIVHDYEGEYAAEFAGGGEEEEEMEEAPTLAGREEFDAMDEEEA